MQQLELTFSLNLQGKLWTRKIPQHLETHWTIHRIHSLPIVFYLPRQTSHPHVHRKKAKTRLSSSDDPDAWWGAQLSDLFFIVFYYKESLSIKTLSHSMLAWAAKTSRSNWHRLSINKHGCDEFEGNTWQTVLLWMMSLQLLLIPTTPKKYRKIYRRKYHISCRRTPMTLQ